MHTHEAEFRGDSRLALVDGLLDFFDQVGAQKRPATWISLEAPSGWGKSRVLREVYRRLATDRQEEPKYWPESVFDEAGDSSLGLAEQRKRIAPLIVNRPGGSLPSWFWWGITCSNRNGLPVAALTADLAQFERHKKWLELAWRASRSSGFKDRHRSAAAQVTKAIGQEALGELRDAALESIIGQAIPGAGLVWELTKWTSGQIREASERRRDERNDAVIDTASAPDIAKDVAASLESLAGPDLPIIIAIEDLHLSDPVFVELLIHLLNGEAPVLVLSTTWPGAIEANELTSRMLAEVPTQRIVRICHDRPAPTELPTNAGLGSLETNALDGIVQHFLPGADHTSTTLLTQRFPNPLALSLVCSLARIRRLIKSDGSLHLTPDQVAGLPSTVEDLYQAMWVELSEDDQTLLIQCAWAMPSSIAPAHHGSQDDRWQRHIVKEIANDVTITSTSDGKLRAWERQLNTAFSAFYEPTQQAVAIRSAEDHFSPSDRDRFYNELTRLVTSSSWLALDGEQGQHRDQLIIALARRGQPIDTTTVIAAIKHLIEALAGSQSRHGRVCELAEYGYQLCLDADLPRLERYWFWDQQLWALGGSGRNSAAIAIGREIITEYTEYYGPGHPTVLDRRYTLAFNLDKIHATAESITIIEDILPRYARIFGQNHAKVTGVQFLLASALETAGRAADALAIRRVAIENHAGRPNHSVTKLRTELLNLSDNLRNLGYQAESDEAMDRAYSVVPESDRTAEDIMQQRLKVASRAMEARPNEESISLFRGILTDCEREFGESGWLTNTARVRLANNLTNTGNPEALPLQLRVLEDTAQKYGELHPETMFRRGWVAETRSILGEHDKAIKDFEDLIAQQSLAMGDDDIHVFTTRRDYARALYRGGRIADQLATLRAAAALATKAFGEFAPIAMTAARDLALALRREGLGEEALEITQKQLAHYRAIDPRSEIALKTLAECASALGKLGRHEEAAKTYIEVYETRLATLGPHDIGVLDPQGLAAYELGLAKQYDPALAIARENASLRIESFGLGKPGAAISLERVAWLLTCLKRYAEGAVAYTQAVESAELAYGENGAETLRLKQILEKWKPYLPVNGGDQ